MRGRGQRDVARPIRGFTQPSPDRLDAREVGVPQCLEVGKVVITGAIARPGVDLLAQVHEVDAWSSGQIPRDELLRRVAGVDGIVALLSERIDEEVLAAAGPQLRIVADVAVGYNNVDVEACAARGVVVTNTPGVLTEATADLTMALVLAATRRLSEGDRLIRSGEPWEFGMFLLLGSSIQGRQLGIVGMGGIGTAVARRAKAFGMTIAYCNRRQADPTVTAQLDAIRMDLPTLLATSDVVSLHCPYSPATHHLIGAEQLAAMKPTAFLINTSRGPVVEEDALVSALRDGQIAGAGLDVYEHEPKVHPGLLEHPQVALAPHLGSATWEARTEMAELAAHNVLAVLRGEDPLTPVSPPP
jgi:glyoxylate reductase